VIDNDKKEAMELENELFKWGRDGFSYNYNLANYASY